MPRPCDPAARVSLAGTNTLGPVLHGPEKQEKRWGRSKRALGSLLLISQLFILLLPPFVSPEPLEEQIPRKETRFPQAYSPPRQPLGVYTAQGLRPQMTKGLPKPRAQSGHPTLGVDVLMSAQGQDLVSLQPGFPKSDCLVPFF